MKKIALSFILAFACILSANAQTDTRNYSAKDFTTISASYVYSIEVTKGNGYNVSIEAPVSLFDLIKVKQNGNNLDFSLKKELPKKLRNLTESIKVTITMPCLEGVDLSGACKLACNGVFSSNGKMFKAELSGASRIKDLCIEAPKVNLEIDGASRAYIFVDTQDVKADIDGASKLEISGNAPVIKADVSGASALNAKNVNCTTMDLEADGASKALVCVQKTLKVDLSGAAKCEYIGPEDLNLRIDSISGASTLRRVK